MKYEDVYIKNYEDARGLRLGVSAYIADYNTARPHYSLGGLTKEKRSYSDLFLFCVLTKERTVKFRMGMMGGPPLPFPPKLR